MHVMNLLKKQAIRVLPVMERRKLVGIITDGALQISLRNHRHGSRVIMPKRSDRFAGTAYTAILAGEAETQTTMSRYDPLLAFPL
ncbi:MAG: hypothetical protein L6406_10855 [Desulfobacterales bacterium]|nr:hypothetical protein [Desulfobacterales bacterium]